VSQVAFIDQRLDREAACHATIPPGHVPRPPGRSKMPRMAGTSAVALEHVKADARCDRSSVTSLALVPAQASLVRTWLGAEWQVALLKSL